MAHDIFISHSSKDKTIADATCACLESRGLRCWIAPRDIVVGAEWGASIMAAIKGAKGMILLVSSHSNVSPQVLREVERAVNRGIPVLPFRIEDVVLSDSLEYFLSSAHWLDAYHGPLKEHLEKLANNAAFLVDRRDAARPVAEPKSASTAIASEGNLQEDRSSTTQDGLTRFTWQQVCCRFVFGKDCGDEERLKPVEMLRAVLVMFFLVLAVVVFGFL